MPPSRGARYAVPAAALIGVAAIALFSYGVFGHGLDTKVRIGSLVLGVLFMFVAVACMTLFQAVDYRVIGRFAAAFYVGSLLLVIYTLIGIIGFFLTGFGDFFGNAHGMAMGHDETLLGFMINPMHNVVHILIGVAGLALARTLAGARTYGWLLAVGYAAAFVYGLIAVGKDWDFLNINAGDNVLHIATALVGLVIALGPVRTVAVERGRDASLRPER